MQILWVGNGNYKQRGAWYYNTGRRLINGLTRNGHNVYLFSDRDISRAGSVFGSRKLGIGHCNRVFLDTCRNFAPELIILAHAYIITNESIMQARAMLPRVKIAQLNVDPLFDQSVMSQMLRKLPLCDATFSTTGGPVLKAFSHERGVASFFPNVIDASIDWPRCHEHSDQHHDVFWAMRPHTPDPSDPRIALPLFLESTGRLAIDYHGLNGRAVLDNASYYTHLADAKMGLSINSTSHRGVRAAEETLYLYSSARIAQYMGSGLLVLCPRGNHLEKLFAEDKEFVLFSSKEELLEKVLYYKAHDDERRRVAKAGWEKAHNHLNERLVAKYMVEVTFRLPLSERYVWPTETY